MRTQRQPSRSSNPNRLAIISSRPNSKTSGLVRVHPGHCTGWSFNKPGPVQPPGRPVPRSTRRAGPGLITMMKTISERYQRDCVFQFLMGLNDSYSPIQDQIMLFGPIPIITRVLSIIQQQECQHQLTSNSTQYNAMAFAIRKPSSFPAKFPSHSRFNLATFVP